MAAVANPEDIDKAFLGAVRKSSKEADLMTEGKEEELDKPSIMSAIKDKAETVVAKVSEVAHKITGSDSAAHHEGKVNKKEPPIGAKNQDAAEFYAERASEKYDSENSSLSSKSNKSNI